MTINRTTQPEGEPQGVGVPLSGSGYSAEPEPSFTVSAVPVSIPNAPWWRCLHCDSADYFEHTFTKHLKGVPMIRCAKCGVLHNPPDRYSKTALRWQILELCKLAEAVEAGRDYLPEWLVEMADRALAEARGEA